MAAFGAPAAARAADACCGVEHGVLLVPCASGHGHEHCLGRHCECARQKNVASLTDTCPPAFLPSHPQHAHIHRLVAAAQLETLHLSTPRQTAVDGVDGEADTGSATTDAASTTNDASCSVAELVKQLTEREAAALAGAGDEQELSWENLSRDLQGSAPPGGQHPLAPHTHATPSC